LVKRALLFLLLLAGCDEAPSGAIVPVGDAGSTPIPTPGELDASRAASLDEPSDAIPRFSTALPLEIEHIERISRFRAGIGHDYSDSYEACRSMKHYLCPIPCPGSGAPPPLGPVPAWTELEVRSPVTGTLVRLELEQTYGTQVVIEPDGYPEVRLKIFHVTPRSELAIGARLAAGQVIGTHASTQTMSDIAVEQGRSDGFRLISFFETLTDEAFAPLALRGVTSPEALMIGATERDAAPLTCQGEQFMAPDTLDAWVALEQP
jgi:hypothetical protein